MESIRNNILKAHLYNICTINKIFICNIYTLVCVKNESAYIVENRL